MRFYHQRFGGWLSAAFDVEWQYQMGETPPFYLELSIVAKA